MLFCHSTSFKFTALAMPSEVEHVMKDWWWMLSLQKHLKVSSFHFTCLTIELLHQLQFVCLFLLKQQWPELARFGNSWHGVTTHSETQTLFLHWPTVIFTGHGLSGIFKAWSLGIRILESNFFFSIPLTLYRDHTNTTKTLLAVQTLSLIVLAVISLQFVTC